MGTVRYTVMDGQVLGENRNGVKHDYLSDPMGNTTALLDNTGAITDTFSYFPSGTVAARTGTNPTPFQWNGGSGYFTDSSTRKYVRARNYFNNLGRWGSQDPIGFDGGDFNLYRYVQNRVVTAKDPSGFAIDSDPVCQNSPGQRSGCNWLSQILCKKSLPSICVYNGCDVIHMTNNNSPYAE